jgi:hypothetical protein
MVPLFVNSDNIDLNKIYAFEAFSTKKSIKKNSILNGACKKVLVFSVA